MIDKKIESDIKSLNEFFEFWMKFHTTYEEIISKDIITKEEEDRFFSIKDSMKSKYDDIRNRLDFKYAPQGRLSDPVTDILSISGIRLISEKTLKKLNDDWRDSYVFLENIIERLKNKKRRLGVFNPVGVFLKRFFKRGSSRG